MARVDELRLIAKVARMYYIQELNQQTITEKLQLHQSTISRMLKKARTMNLVRFNIATPPGTFAELEDQLTSRFDLRDAVVVDCPTEGDALVRDLGAALAYFLETTLKPEKVIGISSMEPLAIRHGGCAVIRETIVLAAKSSRFWVV